MNRYDKASHVEGYVQRADEILEEHDYAHAREFCDEVIAVFSGEIDHLEQNLTQYWSEADADYIQDTKTLRAKLKNYAINIQTGFIKQHPNGENKGTYIGINNDINNQMSVNVFFEATISNINEIPETALSQEDKEILQGKIVGIELAKKNGESKGKIWEKVKPVLEFLIEKGADAAIAAMPYIISALQSS